MARADHQRHVPRAPGVHARRGPAPADQRAPADGDCVPFAAARAAVGRRTMEPGARPRAIPRNAMRRNGPPHSTQQLLARHGVVTREAVAAGIDHRRLRPGLSRAEGDGGERPHPPRLFRRRPWRDAIRHARRTRSASLAARPAGRTRSRGARRDRSGEPLRRGAQVAVAHGTADARLRRQMVHRRARRSPPVRPRQGADPRVQSAPP